VNIEGNTLAMNVEKGNVVKNKSNPRDSCNLIIYNEIEKLEQERRKALTASKLDVNLYSAFEIVFIMTNVQFVINNTLLEID
jgi:hypothetical protein